MRKSMVSTLSEKLKGMELDTLYGKKTKMDLVGSPGSFDLLCCGTKLQQYYFEVPITSAIRMLCTRRSSVFVIGAVVSLTLQHLMETRVRLQSFKFDSNSGVPLLDLTDRKEGTFPIANIDGSENKVGLGLWKVDTPRVQQIYNAVFESTGPDGTLFDAKVKESITLVSGNVKYGDAKGEKHKGIVDKVFYRNAEKGTTLMPLDQTSRDQMRFWVNIDKEISLGQGDGIFTGDHYTILGAVRAANDRLEPFVDQGAKAASAVSYGCIEGMTVRYYYRQ